MLGELQRFLAEEVLPAAERGEAPAGAVDALLANWFRRELGSPKSVRLPKPISPPLDPPAAEALAAGVANVTSGARRLIALSSGLYPAMGYLLGDKLFRAHLRNQIDQPAVRARLNAVLETAPRLLQDPSTWPKTLEPPRPAPKPAAPRPAAPKPAAAKPAGAGARPARGFDAATTLAQLRDLETPALRGFLRRLQDQVVAERIKALFAAKRWTELQRFSDVLMESGAGWQKSMLLVARANIYAGQPATALKMLSVAREVFPTDPEVLIYRGVAHARTENYRAAVADLRGALALQPESIRIKRELGNALRMGSRREPHEAERKAMAAESIALLGTALEAEFSVAAARTLARFLYDCGHFEETITLAERMLDSGGEDVEALVLKSRALVSLNRVAEALALSERVLELDPANQAAQFMLRAMRFLAAGEAPASDLRFGDAVFGPAGLVSVRPLGGSEWTPAADDSHELPEQLRALPFDWLRLTSEGAGGPDPFDAFDVLRRSVDPRAGFHLHAEPGGEVSRIWRVEAVAGLVESSLVGADLAELARFERIYAPGPKADTPGGNAVVMSRHGSFKFGGGEHFIESMAEHYRTVGYDPIIVGTRPDFLGQSGMVNGFRFDFVEPSPAALRRLFLSHDVGLVHVISGLGFAVTEALAYTNIPFIYGVHFWREALGTATDENFFDQAGEPLARPEFHYILSRAATVYANSEFTRDVLERAFGVRCPVVFSVPKEGAPA